MLPTARRNLLNTAEEYSQIPVSIEQMLDSTEGFVNTLQTTFDEGQIAEVDAVVRSYTVLEDNLQTFRLEIESLLSILRSEHIPNSVSAIESIEQSCRTVVRSVERFRNRCDDLGELFEKSGLAEQADSISTVSSALGEFPDAIRESFFTNQFLLAVQASHFPGTLKRDVSKLIDTVESSNSDRRLNTIFILVAIADEYPDAVASYCSRLAEILPTASTIERRNILATLLLTADSQRDYQAVIKQQAVNLLDSNDIHIALYAAMLLSRQDITKRQSELVTARIGTLLDSAEDDDVLINATYAIYQMANSRPESIESLVPEVANLLDDSDPQVCENVIETLVELGRDEYRDDIAKVHSQTTDSNLRDVTTEALETLSGTSSERPVKTNPSEYDSVLEEIKDLFENP